MPRFLRTNGKVELKILLNLIVRSYIFGTNSSDDFIDNGSDLENLAVTRAPRSRQITENTSHHFRNTAPVPIPQLFMSQRDDMEGCDDFMRAKADECYQNLIRLRNDVRLSDEEG